MEPTITGAANMVEGTYDFASKHFEMTRGRISFDGNSPPNPRLDMAATATVNSLTATVSVRGTSLKPEIAFTSVPALPEEELLARILFGDSITQISAPEALQLGAALAALHGGGGLDPINKLRTAIGLDRLRFVSADAALGRQTGVAVGKYLGRHFYAELVSDGRGYSATNLEFRLSSWLALLGSVASTGRQSVNAKVSRDY
jgi:translocation and assembly module TamB